MDDVTARITLLLNAVALDEARHAFSVMAEDDNVREDNDAETMAEVDRIDAVLSRTPDDRLAHEVTLSRDDWRAVAKELEHRHGIARDNASFLRSDRSRGVVEEWERAEAGDHAVTAGQIRCAISLIERETQI